MIRAPFEVSGEGGSFRVKVQAASMRRAEKVLRSKYPNGDVRLVLPIDGEDFFTDHGEGEKIEGQSHLK